jgi:hypothetical protein
MIEADSVHSTPPLNTPSIQGANPRPEPRAESVDSILRRHAIGQPESQTLLAIRGALYVLSLANRTTTPARRNLSIE